MKLRSIFCCFFILCTIIGYCNSGSENLPPVNMQFSQNDLDTFSGEDQVFIHTNSATGRQEMLYIYGGLMRGERIEDLPPFTSAHLSTVVDGTQIFRRVNPINGRVEILRIHREGLFLPVHRAREG